MAAESKGDRFRIRLEGVHPIEVLPDGMVFEVEARRLPPGAFDELHRVLTAQRYYGLSDMEAEEVNDFLYRLNLRRAVMSRVRRER